MTDYADVIYIDPRNAAITTRDHRTGTSGGQPMIVRVPPTTPTVQYPPAASVPAPTNPSYPYPYPTPNSPYPYPTSWPQGYPTNWPQGWPPGGAVPPGYPAPYPYGQYPPMSGVGSFLQGLGGAGAVVDMAAQVVAALLPLPTTTLLDDDSPVSTNDLMDYQERLARYAKTDEMIRTGGALVKSLLTMVR